MSGCCDNFGSGFTTHSQNAFYVPIRSCNWLKVCGKTGTNATYTWIGHGILFSLNVVFNAPCIVFSLQLRLISFFPFLFLVHSYGHYAEGTGSVLKMANIDVSFLL